ncbi:hypothetical protein ACJRO7_000894 [Eucalyptus globulus]|uniref:C2H2-type domain-containing protein n=1 Tax=Eucalyptus globulus TaxID=34317 RepID=A0ABD3LP66_EUCGL
MQEAAILYLDWTSVRLGDRLRRSIKSTLVTHRPFKCSIGDCPTSYRRKDHLIFNCPVGGCNKSFACQGNIKRHMNEIHNDELPATSGEFKNPKQHFASQSRKHEDSHVKLETMEAFCYECMKYFSNKKISANPKAFRFEAICMRDRGKKFVYKHMIDHHEKTGCHGDFDKFDEQFRSRPRGRRKRKCPTIKFLLPKRVTLPNELDFLSD